MLPRITALWALLMILALLMTPLSRGRAMGWTIAKKKMNMNYDMS
jgi:hypothetical protein